MSPPPSLTLPLSLSNGIIIITQEGMGGVRITSDGLQVQDSAEFLDTVYLESIKADDEVYLN